MSNLPKDSHSNFMIEMFSEKKSAIIIYSPDFSCTHRHMSYMDATLLNYFSLLICLNLAHFLINHLFLLFLVISNQCGISLNLRTGATGHATLLNQ